MVTDEFIFREGIERELEIYVPSPQLANMSSLWFGRSIYYNDIEESWVFITFLASNAHFPH